MNLCTKLPVAACLALLAACGGSAGNAALSKSFSYGAPQAPNSTEASAATTAQGQLSTTTGFSAQPDAIRGAAIIAFADTLAAAAFGSAGIPGGRGPGASEINHAIRVAADPLSACTTVSANSVTFNNCSVTESNFTITFSGSISVGAGSVTWNISGGFSGSDSTSNINIAHHQSGTLAVTAGSLKGDALSDVGGTVSSGGQSVSFGVATAALFDLTFTTAPFCVTGGNVELKRVWSQKPSGATGPAFTDVGLKLAWTGCNAVTVSHSQ